MTPDLDAVRAYWEAYARNLPADGGQGWGSREFFAAIKIDHDRMYGGANAVLGLDGLHGRSLLEVACGIGLDTVEFAGHGAEVVAIDASPACVELARRFLRYEQLEATVELGDAENLPYASGAHDVVVCRGLLMFTPSDARVVEEVHRVLKPGGRAQFLVHHRYSWYVLLAAISGTNRVGETGEPPINRLYSAGEMRRMLGKFTSVDVTYDRFPVASKRGGISAGLFNHIVVPVSRVLPRRLVRRFGYYLIVTAVK